MPSNRGPLEKDTCRDYVVPALAASGWNPEMIREQYPVKASDPTPGVAANQRFSDGRVDYVLEPIVGIPAAVVEAKREYSAPGHGLQQAVRYAQQLDAPLAYSTNGRAIIERDLVAGRERELVEFPTPAEVWARYVEHQGLDAAGAELISQPFNRKRTTVGGDVIAPRWYQTMAIHRVLRAIAQNRDRVLLLMATGTGKTFTAMQIVAKLRSYHRAIHPGRNFRVLYLADLDVLLTQPMSKDFTPAFGSGPLHRVKGGLNVSREIYFASYQALTGQGDTAALFRDYRPNFFDLVIVDECHRGSAAADSSWREVLKHFSPAVQLGLTATPRSDAVVDSYDYFGNPVFEYTLRQGIEDGFLAPYRVRRVVLSPDAEGWSPSKGQLDRFGHTIPPGLYSTRDFERVVSLLMRTKLASRHLSTLLRRDPTARAMVFCVDRTHAEDMRRELVEANADLVAKQPEWAVRIVGEEPERIRLLEAFMDPQSDSPVVATTSRLLSTGVDVEDLKYVVLFRPVGSKVEFKQIIGRGTRLYPEKGKRSFEIVDYVGATAHFDDPDFDGYPMHRTFEVLHEDGEVTVVDEGAEDPCDSHPGSGNIDRPTDSNEEAPQVPGDNSPVQSSAPRKLYVDIGDFRVVAEGIQVPDSSTGDLRLTEYGEYVSGTVRTIAGSPGDLTRLWAQGPTREQVLDVLQEKGIDLAELTDGDSAAFDPLDVLLQLAWNQRALTRAERARRAKLAHAAEIDALSSRAQQVLAALLDRYAVHGLEDMTSSDVLSVRSLRSIGTPIDIAREFGGPSGWHVQLDQLQKWLYPA